GLTVLAGCSSSGSSGASGSGNGSTASGSAGGGEQNATTGSETAAPTGTNASATGTSGGQNASSTGSGGSGGGAKPVGMDAEGWHAPERTARQEERAGVKTRARLGRAVPAAGRKPSGCTPKAGTTTSTRSGCSSRRERPSRSRTNPGPIPLLRTKRVPAPRR